MHHAIDHTTSLSVCHFKYLPHTILLVFDVEEYCDLRYHSHENLRRTCT